MLAEIITIGDELLIGQVVDTNSAWMGQELNKIGIEVLRTVSIRDREDEIIEAIDNAMKRVNIVLVTGGLGPTKDDITKQTLCKYFQTELVFSEEVFENVKRVLAGKIPMNALNKNQAMVPKDCTVIQNPVGYLPKPGVIRLRLTGRGQNEKEIEALLSIEKTKLKELLGEDLFSEEDTPLEIVVGELLKKKKLTVSTAESCTGGSIAARITSIAGSSEYFKGSIVAYSNDIKEALLHVSPETLRQHGAVSEETVIEMVKGAMKTLKTDCAVATSGIAGPGGGTPEKPVGTVWIAAGYKNEIHTYKQETNRGRAMNIERAANNALLMLQDLLK